MILLVDIPLGIDLSFETFIYRISSIKRPGVYFFRGEIYPAFKRGRRLYGAGVYFSLLAPAPYKLH